MWSSLPRERALRGYRDAHHGAGRRGGACHHDEATPVREGAIDDRVGRECGGEALANDDVVIK